MSDSIGNRNDGTSQVLRGSSFDTETTHLSETGIRRRTNGNKHKQNDGAKTWKELPNVQQKDELSELVKGDA
jgi:hypothetical protein